MEISENNRYKIISIVLIVAIISIVVFAILPNFLPKTPEKAIEKIDFSNSRWVEQYVENRVDLFGKDFYVGTAFSYNIRSNKIIVTYATLKTVEEAREHYLNLPEAELSGRNDETTLNVSTTIDGQDLRVYNYYSPISRVIELELILNYSNAEQIITQLESAFPSNALRQMNGFERLTSGEVFGGYVRYQYNQFDGYAYPNVPIFSRAYFFDGSKAEFDMIINALDEAYPQHKFDDTQKANYYQIDGQIVSISYLVTDLGEKIVTISIQQIPN